MIDLRFLVSSLLFFILLHSSSFFFLFFFAHTQKASIAVHHDSWLTSCPSAEVLKTSIYLTISRKESRNISSWRFNHPQKSRTHRNRPSHPRKQRRNLRRKQRPTRRRRQQQRKKLKLQRRRRCQKPKPKSKQRRRSWEEKMIEAIATLKEGKRRTTAQPYNYATHSLSKRLGTESCSCQLNWKIDGTTTSRQIFGHNTELK